PVLPLAHQGFARELEEDPLVFGLGHRATAIGRRGSGCARLCSLHPAGGQGRLPPEPPLLAQKKRELRSLPAPGLPGWRPASLYPTRMSSGIDSDHGWYAVRELEPFRGDQPWSLATSSAKDSVFFSRPSPSTKRAKRRTVMFSPILAMAAFTTSWTVWSGSFTKGCSSMH